MSSDDDRKLNFIQKILPKLIKERNEDLQNQEIVKCAAEACSSLDGFMSAIYTVELVLKDQSGKWVIYELRNRKFGFIFS